MSQNWKSLVEVELYLDSIDRPSKLSKLFSLSRFWNSAIYPESYKASERWEAIAVLSEYGNRMLEILHNLDAKATTSDKLLQLFVSFYHHDLFFDYEKCDIDGIVDLLSAEIRQFHIQIPHRFGRRLYDRFHEMDIHGRTDHLPPEHVTKLISGTPQGVYQMDVFVSGPLGIIKSSDVRFFPPSVQLPLWHCSDTGCGALHSVELLQFDDTPPKIAEHFDDVLESQFGKPSEWFAPLMMMHREDKYEYGRYLSDIPLAIGDCLFGVERSSLVEQMLKSSNSTAMREIIERVKGRDFSSGSPSDVASKLDEEEQLQLLCIATDHQLQENIDALIFQRKIRIGLGEIRETKTSSYLVSHFDTGTEFGFLGVRSTDVNPILKLTTLILSAYTESKSLPDLAWRLHSNPDQNIKSALIEHFGKFDTAKIVTDIIFPSRDVTSFICKEVGLKVPQGEFGVDFSNQLLWKLGFNPPIFPDYCARFHARIQDFENILLGLEAISGEDDREKARSAGVNLFVSLEEFIEILVSYNSWLLGADHFKDTNFVYNFLEACAIVPSILGKSISNDNVDFSWVQAGGNTLGCSMQYFSALIEWIKNLEKGVGRESLLRPDSDLPHFADNPNYTFPFRHTQLWADAELHSIRKIGRELGEIYRLLAQSNLAKIRNGLDHKRDEENFPSIDEMLSCSVRLKQALEQAEARRYFPNEHWLVIKRQTHAGFFEFEFTDYRGRIIRLNGPNVASGMRSATFGTPMLICPGNLIGVSNSEMILNIKQKSIYSDYWANYPKRRIVPPESKRD